MSTRISDVRPSHHPPRGFDVREVIFAVSDARRALPYVARLMRDAVHAYECVQEAREALLVSVHKREMDELICRRDYAIDRLNEIIDECNAVGLAHVHIPTGRAAFHAQIAQRRATLLWHVGQPIKAAWCELDDLDRPQSEPNPQLGSATAALSPNRQPSANGASADVSSSCGLDRAAHAAS